MKRHFFPLIVVLFAAFMVACSEDSSETPPVTPEVPTTPSTPVPEETVKNGSIEGKIIGTQWSVDYNNQ